MARLTEMVSIVGAGAAGAAMAVVLIGGSLLLIRPAVAIVGVVTLTASGTRPRRSARR